MRVWHISDTHGMHDQLSIPEGIDMVICTGDISNHPDISINAFETGHFFGWLSKQDIKHKIVVPGNHDGYLEQEFLHGDPVTIPGIHILIHESIEIEGIKIFGSPYTPAFEDWSFMVDREYIKARWHSIPSDADIVATHGPPAGIKDQCFDLHFKRIIHTGDMALMAKIWEVEPKYHLFGHLHNGPGYSNEGVIQITEAGINTTFINSSCVTDGEFHKGLTSNGNVFEI